MVSILCINITFNDLHTLAKEITMTPPTNEPKMPDVIYADNKQEAPNLRYCYHRQMDGTTTYHHDDKVQELKMCLVKCVEALEHTCKGTGHNCELTRLALTKASNLLK